MRQHNYLNAQVRQIHPSTIGSHSPPRTPDPTTNLANQGPSFRNSFSFKFKLAFAFSNLPVISNFSVVSFLWNFEEKTMASSFSNIGAICKLPSAPSISSISRALFPTTLCSYSHSRISRPRSVLLDLPQLIILFYSWFFISFIYLSFRCYEFWILVL